VDRRGDRSPNGGTRLKKRSFVGQDRPPILRVSGMAEKRQLELYLLRFLPHALRDDFVTVGVLLLETGGGFAEVRFTRDWRMLQCVAPDVELEWFDMVEREIRGQLGNLKRREELMQLMTSRFGTLMDVAPTKALLAEDPVKEMEVLSSIYLVPMERRTSSIHLVPMERRKKESMPVNTGRVLPLVGRIAAGRPIEAVQNNETISLEDFVQKDVFVLEVRGESMRDEAILDGDYVLVEKKKTARDGDIVVALVESTDATLKRFFREGENIRLQPSNAAMEPIIVPAVSVQIQGRVIGMLRKY
jgi:SOS regulatory protein LexA